MLCTSLTPLNNLIYRSTFIYRSYNRLNSVWLFWTTLYICTSQSHTASLYSGTSSVSTQIYVHLTAKKESWILTLICLPSHNRLIKWLDKMNAELIYAVSQHPAVRWLLCQLSITCVAFPWVDVSWTTVAASTSESSVEETTLSSTMRSHFLHETTLYNENMAGRM